nr:hypothetical protein [Streptomyces sp. SID8367]
MEATVAARRFTERVPWLTETQAADIQRAYVEAHVRSLRATAARAETQYRLLRARLLTAAFFIGVGAAGVTAIAAKILSSTP